MFQSTSSLIQLHTGRRAAYPRNPFLESSPSQELTRTRSTQPLRSRNPIWNISKPPLTHILPKSPHPIYTNPLCQSKNLLTRHPFRYPLPYFPFLASFCPTIPPFVHSQFYFFSYNQETLSPFTALYSPCVPYQCDSGLTVLTRKNYPVINSPPQKLSAPSHTPKLEPFQRTTETQPDWNQTETRLML